MTNSLISKLYHGIRGNVIVDIDTSESLERLNEQPDNQSAYCAVTNANPMFSHVIKRDYVLDNREY